MQLQLQNKWQWAIDILNNTMTLMNLLDTPALFLQWKMKICAVTKVCNNYKTAALTEIGWKWKIGCRLPGGWLLLVWVFQLNLKWKTGQKLIFTFSVGIRIRRKCFLVFVLKWVIKVFILFFSVCFAPLLSCQMVSIPIMPELIKVNLKGISKYCKIITTQLHVTTF